MCGWGQSFHGRAKVVQKSVMRVTNLTPKSVLCLRYSCKKHRKFHKFLAKTQIQTKALGKSIVFVLAEKLPRINILDVQNVRRCTLFSELGCTGSSSIPAPFAQKREKTGLKDNVFCDPSDGHRLSVCAKHRKFQRKTCLDPRKTAIRHHFALEIGMS